MNEYEIKKEAANLRERSGGTIFAFPILPDEPFSKYAVVVYAGGLYHTYPEATNISLAALGVKTILECMQKEGYDIDFERDVRLVSYEAQMNAPDVTMRRLRKDAKNFKTTTPDLNKGIDFHQVEGVEGMDDGEYVISARGLIKFCYLSMVEDKKPMGAQFMDEYYKLLAMRKYGKTASAIKQEVRRMSKNEAISWIERTYKSYIRDDLEVMNILNRLGGVTT